MEQKFSNNSLDLETLREFCRREGEAVIYRRGDQLEREGDPARWLAFVTEGCFKYVTHGLSDDREHITWFLTSSSFTNRENPLSQNMADDPEHDIFRLAKTITTGFSPVQSDSIENVTLRSSRIQSMKWQLIQKPIPEMSEPTYQYRAVPYQPSAFPLNTFIPLVLYCSY